MTTMNGRVANSTLPAPRLIGRRPLRALALVAGCLLSLALLGAVRTQALPEAERVAASDEAVPVGALEQSTDDAMPAAFTERATPVLEIPKPSREMLVPITRTPVIPPRPAVVLPRTRQIQMEVTAYCACRKCCGPRAQGITASGKRVSFNGGRFVAADPKVLKFNTKLVIPGYANGQPVQVIDKGGAIKGNKLDVFFASHQEARQWGRQKLVVTVIEE